MRRTAQWPTLAAMFTPRRPSRLSRNAPKLPPVQSTTVPPRMRRSRSATADRVRAVHLERVRSEEQRTRVGVHVIRRLAQLVDHTRILRVAVREVARPYEAVGADDRGQHLRRDLARIEADPALPLEVFARRERQAAGRPPVALEELVEPVHPVRDPTAAALEDRDL